MTRFRLAQLIIILAMLVAACGQSEPDIQAAADLSGDAINSQAVPAEGNAAKRANADSDDATSASSAMSNGETADGTTSAESADVDASTTQVGTSDTAANGAAVRTLDGAEGQLMLAAVVSDTEAASTGRFEGQMTLGMDPSSGAADATIAIDGSFDMANDATEMTIDLTEITNLMQASPDSSGDDPLMALGMFPGMFDQPIRFVNADGRSFVQWPFLSSLFASFSGEAEPSVAPGDMWIEGTSEDLDGAADSFGATGLTDDVLPTDLLDQLRDADAKVEEIGPETIRGAATTHYRVTMDAESMAAASGEELSAEELAELEALDGQTVDLWVDEQGLARKIWMVVDESTMEAGADATDTEDNPISSMTLEFELFDLGQPVTITTPPEDSILPSDDLGLSGGFDA